MSFTVISDESVTNLNDGIGVLSDIELKLIREYRKRYVKVGGYWLSPEGRKEIRNTWVDPDDGNIALPLLNEVERLEEALRSIEEDLLELEEKLDKEKDEGTKQE